MQRLLISLINSITAATSRIFLSPKADIPGFVVSILSTRNDISDRPHVLASAR